PDVTEGARAPAHVLVIDDDSEMRKIMRRILESDGDLVTERGRGSDALAALREGSFNLIILDKEMPGGNGLDLLPKLCRECPGIPILFVTAFGGPHVAASALGCGAAGYLEKPFRLGQLRAAVNALLSGTSGKTD